MEIKKKQEKIMRIGEEKKEIENEKNKNLEQEELRL